MLHAAWNLLAKRAQAADTVVFVWLTTVTSVALYLPFVVAFLIAAPLRRPLTAIDLAFIAGTAIAACTLWDKHAMSALAIALLVYKAGSASR